MLLANLTTFYRVSHSRLCLLLLCTTIAPICFVIVVHSCAFGHLTMCENVKIHFHFANWNAAFHNFISSAFLCERVIVCECLFAYVFIWLPFAFSFPLVVQLWFAKTFHAFKQKHKKTTEKEKLIWAVRPGFNQA